jgi:hypothetical protein
LTKKGSRPKCPSFTRFFVGTIPGQADERRQAGVEDIGGQVVAIAFDAEEREQAVDARDQHVVAAHAGYCAMTGSRSGCFGVLGLP